MLSKEHIQEIEKMGEEAIKYYNNMKDDPLIATYMQWDFGFAFFTSKGALRYVYIKPSERNKGLCTNLIKNFKTDSPSPEVIHIMDKAGLLNDLKSTNDFKYVLYAEDDLIIYDIELGYQCRIFPQFMVAEYNRWNGEHFEVVEAMFPPYQLQLMRKEMKKKIGKLDGLDDCRIEIDHYDFRDC